MSKANWLQRLGIWLFGKKQTSPIKYGLIWRWNSIDFMSEKEYEYWSFNTLPWGWSIISKPK